MIVLTNPKAHASDCIRVFTEHTRTVVNDVAHAGGSSVETVDLEARTLRSVPGAGSKKVSPQQRTLEAAELKTFREALASLCLKKTAPNGDSPPGGSFYYELQDADGSKRRLAYYSADPAIDFYLLGTEEAQRLGEAWPGLEGPRQPPSTEARVKQFLVDLIFGEPGGGPDLARATARLDPKHELFEVTDLGHSGGYAVQVQLRPRSAHTLDVRALASALDVTDPLAYLANGEHGIWVLGSHGQGTKPLSTWRTAELRVELTLPAKTTVSSTHGETRGLDGVGVGSIILRAKALGSSTLSK